MNDEHSGEQDVEALARTRGRPVAAVMLLVAAVTAVFTWLELDRAQSFYLAPIVIGSFCAFLGLGGLVEPRLLWSIGPWRAHFPMWVRVVGAALAITSVAVAVAVVWTLRVGLP